MSCNQPKDGSGCTVTTVYCICQCTTQMMHGPWNSTAQPRPVQSKSYCVCAALRCAMLCCAGLCCTVLFGTSVGVYEIWLVGLAFLQCIHSGDEVRGRSGTNAGGERSDWFQTE